MKKTLLIIISIATLVAIAVLSIGVYIMDTPEYALKEVIEDVNISGIGGLYPHLTNEARKTIDTITSVTENNFLSSVIGLISQSEYASILKTEIQEVEWHVEDVLKSKENACVILAFNYEDKLIGTIELSMTKENGNWMIDRLKFPKFDKIGL